MSPSYTPTEPSAVLAQERSLLDGAVLCGMVYGVHIVVFFFCLHVLLTRPTRERMTIFNVAFITTLFILGTMIFASNLKLNELMFIDNREFPGNVTAQIPAGPYGWIITHLDTPVNVWNDSVFFMANVLADGLLVFRTYVIWGRSWWVIAFPLLLFAADIGTGVLTTIYIAQPTKGFSLVPLPYFVISNFLNIFLTCLIVGRLYWQSRRMKNALGLRHGRVYVSVANIVVESALPYAVCAIVYTITFAIQSPIANVALLLLGQIMCISPELIVLRVAIGQGWRPPTTTNGISMGPTTTNIPVNTTRSSQWHTISPPDATSAISSQFSPAEKAAHAIDSDTKDVAFAV